MLKFLTHKLRTHSLNEESVSEKVEERDSGTESDDEADRTDSGDFCTDVIMKWNDVTDISESASAAVCACPPPARPPLPPPPEHDLLYDHHSSEEELEVINGSDVVSRESRRRAASSPAPGPAPGKRKWPSPRPRPPIAASRPPSSDDDDTKVETPVRFRTSPPLEALKPRRAGGVLPVVEPTGGAGCWCAGGAAGGVVGGAGGDVRRRRAVLPPRRHRPALDFDKMQQLKVGARGSSGSTGAGRGVRWRAVGAPRGELSVFCW